MNDYPEHFDLNECEWCGETTKRRICKTCEADYIADQDDQTIQQGYYAIQQGYVRSCLFFVLVAWCSSGLVLTYVYRFKYIPVLI